MVGSGGAAAHVLQQLAYLGTGAIVPADADTVDITSLNRLIGALPPRRRTFLDRLLGRGKGDVGRLKVEVMTRMINAIDSSIQVTPYPEFFPTEATVKALRHCDLIVACVDRLQVRDDLNRFAKRYLIPMIDVGIEITPGRDHPGAVEAITGRVTKVLPAGPCLRCQGVIDDGKLAAERGGQPLGLHRRRPRPDPAVVTLNGIVASAAATEVLQQLTGFAGDSAPNCGWIYDGLTGTVERAIKAYRGCDRMHLRARTRRPVTAWRSLNQWYGSVRYWAGNASGSRPWCRVVAAIKANFGIGDAQSLLMLREGTDRAGCHRTAAPS